MDARSTHRYPVVFPATMWLDGEPVDCSVRNLSLGGVFVHGPSLRIGTRVKLRFGGGGLREIECACTARWHTPDGSGLMFDGLRAADTYSLATFIATATRDLPIGIAATG